MSGHTERDLETAIEAGLAGSGGYETRSPDAYDEVLALFPADVPGFLKESQPARWQALEVLLRPKTAATVLDGLSKDGIEATVAAHLSIDTRPARCTRFKARFGSDRLMGNIPK